MTPNATTYDEWAASQNAQYVRDYEKWLRDLTPSQRRKVLKLKMEAPELDRMETHQPEKDVSEWIDLAAAPVESGEKLADVLAENFDISPEAAMEVAAFVGLLIEGEAERRKSTQLNRIVAMLLRPGNPVIRNHALACAANLNLLNGLGRNQTEVARKIGAGKANLSKEVNKWSDLLDLPRSPLQKSEEARQVYSEERKRNHWRNRKCSTSTQQPK